MSSAARESILDVDNEFLSSRNPAEAALLARIVRYFDNAIRALPKKDQAKALAAPNDFWTLMETLALAPVNESPELKVRLRGAIARRQLLEMEGGVLSPSSVAELLHISRQAVGHRRAGGKLLGIEGPRGYLYPAWQFDGDRMLHGIEEIFDLLKDEDPWSKLIFFVRTNDAAGGKRPLGLLRKGKLEAVKRAAELYHVHAAV